MTDYISHWDLSETEPTQSVRPSAASKSDVDEDTLVKAAKEALTRPRDFAYYGDLPMFESWGFVFFQSAASGTVERSNFRTAKSALEGRAVHDDGDQAPDDDASLYVQEIHVSHWLVGSADHLAVRVLVDEQGDITADNLTHTFVHAVELALSLQDYPVLDESDWSELESEGQEAAWGAYLCSEVVSAIEEHFDVISIDELQLRPNHVKFDGWNSIEEIRGDNNNDSVRNAYYRHESTEWVEEDGSSFYNANHDAVMADLLQNLFTPRAVQIDMAHSDAIREDISRDTDSNQTTIEFLKGL